MIPVSHFRGHATAELPSRKVHNVSLTPTSVIEFFYKRYENLKIVSKNSGCVGSYCIANLSFSEKCA